MRAPCCQRFSHVLPVMQTVFISASDTGSGKTYVTAALACHLLRRGHSVQVVKVVETGVTAATPFAQTDAGFVEVFVRKHAPAHLSALNTRTLQHFAKPLAPVDAAQAEGYAFSFDTLTAAFSALPQTADWLLVEGAGGLAVPLEAANNNTLPHSGHTHSHESNRHSSTPPDSVQYSNTASDATHLSSTDASARHTNAPPRDWADFALAIEADATLLVVADRLGAINQARLLAAYAHARQLPQCGLWLNATALDTGSDVRRSNASALTANAAALPLWAIHNHGELWPQDINAPWLS